MGLRIVHVLEATHGGAARHMVDLAETQLEAGHDVAAIVSPAKMDDAMRSSLERLEKLGLKVHHLPMERLPKGLSLTLGQYRRIVRSLGRVDVIHGHSSRAGMVMRLGPSPGAARVYTPHALFTMNPNLSPRARAAVAMVERALARRTKAIIANSVQERDHALEIGLPAQRLHVVPNGLRLAPTGDRAQSRAALGYDEATPIMGFVGRLVPQKEPLAALQAFEKIQAERSNARFVVVGGGELDVECRAFAEKRKLNVDWLGHVDALPIVPAFDVLLLSSSYESFGYVILEALVNGVPVVATPTGVAEILLASPEAGRIVPIGDAEAMAGAALECLDSLPAGPERRERVRDSLVPFSVEGMGQAVEGLYRAILESQVRR